MANRTDPTRVPPPKRRPLQVFAFDPSRQSVLGNKMQIDVRHRVLEPGPVELGNARDQIAVVDYDASNKTYYCPVNLDNPYVLMQSGIAPTESDPRFHQQMVYAIVSDTIEQFESALGRRIHWRRAERELRAAKGWRPEDILTLSLYPHAMEQANAYYSPEAHGILFGYFQASRDNPGHNLPGQTVFTCLSHDIIVHETTHAILDGLRSHFLEATNPDVPAFHEAFADVVALFRHFTHREVLLDVIRRTGGRLYSPALRGDPLADQASQSSLEQGDEERNPLIELAGQFGEAIGMRSALRSAIGKRKTMKELRETSECHERGSILVAAIFDAFFTVYLQRAAGPFRIYRSAGGYEREDLPSPLVEALCDVATQTATDFFRTCVRSVDYLPPVDIRFGDFLRSVMTSERDFDPGDHEGIRDAWMQAFRSRGILPDDAPFFSEDALCWPVCTEELLVEGLPFGGPAGLTYVEQQQTAEALTAFIEKDDHKKLLGLVPDLQYTIPSFHPLYRTSRDGSVRWDLIVEVVQKVDSLPFPQRGGGTMIISTHSTGGIGGSALPFLRYFISKPLGGIDGTRRATQQTAYLDQQGYKRGGQPSQWRVNFSLVHGGE